MYRRIFYIVIINFITSLSVLHAQCPEPELYDLDLSETSDNPTWVNCIDNSGDPDNYILDLISPDDIPEYEINWGDGNTETGVDWDAGVAVSHEYTDLGEFTVTLTVTENGCSETITGTFINDRKPGATATPPTTNANGCAPHTLTFVNESTNASEFTTYTWDWGDESEDVISNPNDDGAPGNPIDHTYLPGTSDCGMEVTLTATSLCETSFVTYGPYNMWDLDTASVSASSTRLCVGDSVTFNDVSIYNCITGTRRIRWDFTDVGGSQTGWLPAVPANRTQTHYIDGPIGSTYTVSLADSNGCGVDVADIEIEIVAPPEADMEPDKDTACAGEAFNFENNSGGNRYYWNFGDGDGWQQVNNASTQSHAYESSGDYTVQHVAEITGSTQCRDTTSVDVHVITAPDPSFSVSEKEGCEELTTTFTDASSGAISWNWNFGNGSLETGPGPFTETYTDEAPYIVTLTTENTFGCESSYRDTVYVYPKPELEVLTDSVCFGQDVVFDNNTTLADPQRGSILYERYEGIPTSNLDDLKNDPDFPDNPDAALYQPSFKSPVDVSYSFGAQMHGYIYPPADGNYVFWIASDDDSELWLSTGEHPDSVQLIAEVDGYTNEEQWNKFPSQQSSAIFLEAGKKYYIQALHKEGSGSDHVAVGWQLPNGTLERPVPGNRLSPFMEGLYVNEWEWDFGDGSPVSNEIEPTHVYTDEGTIYATLTANTGKCSTTDSFPVFVAPEVSADFNVDPEEGCSPLTVDIVNQSEGAERYYWTYGDGTERDTLDTSEDSTSYTYFNNSSSSRNYLLEVVAEGQLNCRDTLRENIQVYPSPQVSFDADLPTPPCSPFQANFTNTSVNQDTVYTWYIGQDTVTTSDTNIEYGFENTSDFIRFDTVRLEIVSGDGCVGFSSQTVNVFPEPEYEVIVDEDTGCHPHTANFAVNNAASSFSWDFGDGNLSNQPAPSNTFLHTGDSDTTYTTTAVITSLFSCKDTLTQEVTVKPQNEADFTATPATQIYPDRTVEVTDQSSGEIHEWLWLYGDGDTATGPDPVPHEYDTSGVYTIQLIIDNGYCTDTAEQVVTIEPPEPVAAFSGGDTACAPLSVQFTNQSLHADQFEWDFGDGASSTATSPSHTYSSPGQYDVSLQVSGPNGTDNITQTGVVVVTDQLIADFDVDPEETALPDAEVDFTNNSSVEASDFIWDFGDGDSAFVADPATHQYDSTGDFTITLFVSNELENCADTVSKEVTVLPAPPVAGFTGGDTACAPLTVSFTDTSERALTYSWDFGDGDTSDEQNPSHTYEDPGLYDVSLTVTGENGSDNVTRSSIVIVHEFPEADFSFTPDELVYPDATFDFTNESSSDADIFYWEFGDGQSDSTENTSHTYDEAGTFAVTYYASNAFDRCHDTVTKEVTIQPQPPHAAFSGGDTACAPLAIRFTNESERAAQYLWDFGDGGSSTEINPRHTYDEPGEYTVQLVSYGSNGSDTVSQEVVWVKEKLKADFEPDEEERVYPDATFEFTNNSSVEATYFIWRFGDGTSLESDDPQVQYTYPAAGEYTVRLEASNDFANCGDFVDKEITILPQPPAADFSGSDTSCAPVTVSFVNESKRAVSYRWFFGDGDSSNAINPTHTYTESGLYDVTLIAQGLNNGSDTLVKNEVVYVPELPEASFEASPESQVFPGTEVNINNNSSGNIEDYRWDFGDSTTSTLQQPGSHDYEHFGNYDISLVVGNDIPKCEDSTTRQIEIKPPLPQAAFAGADSGCVPVQVAFTNESENGESYEWYFGDGATSTEKSPSHTYTGEGIYDVKLVVTNATGKDSVTHTAVVGAFAAPTAYFTSNPSSNVDLLVPANVFFNNLSENATTYHWDFGNGNTSQQEDVVNTYKEPGTYEVTLQATSDFGCQDEYTAVPPFTVIEGGKAFVPNAFKPVGSLSGNDTFKPKLKGNIRSYKMQIFNRWGELIFETEDYNEGWDGYYRGELCQQGVYVYRIDVRFYEGNDKSLVGDVTLIK